VYRRTCHKPQWPFVGEGDDAEDEVYDLEDWDGFDGFVEVFGVEVPEDLGPEEAL
jgi:hypothetical protein